MPQVTDIREWQKARIREDQITRYMAGDTDFIPDDDIRRLLEAGSRPDAARVREILAKSLSIQTLTMEETAALLRVEDPDLRAEMETTALAVKKKVYDNRIVTFAPLYLSNLCVNACRYCGFRADNPGVKRCHLDLESLRREVEVLAGVIGHKRLIVVYGEHPSSGIDYMAQTIRTIYEVKVPARRGFGQIRRVNVNAPPLPVEELKTLAEIGVGTYQVFQETYDRFAYRRLHPEDTIKGHFRWRLYAMHRALEAGIDDVGIGALFGLADWRYEVLGLVCHARELERAFGIGPHTISFPRLEPAVNTPLASSPTCPITNATFRHLITVLRLAVPYTGMILTARENASVRRSVLPLGITQTDASSRIGIGAYADARPSQDERQQFYLGDTRSLDEVVRELAQMGLITSFCTAGYRCGRTGSCIMDLLRSGAEGRFCKLNAVLTFREWLDDFASEETRRAGEPVIEAELAEIREKMPAVFPKLMEYYCRIQDGERDLFF